MNSVQKKQISTLRSPERLESLEELHKLIPSRPNYVGPEAWIGLVQQEVKEIQKGDYTK